MKSMFARIFASGSVFVVAACAQPDALTSRANSVVPAPAGGTIQSENRTALNVFYGMYETVRLNEWATVPTFTSTQTLTCGTLTQIGNQADHPNEILKDPRTGEIVKVDEVSVEPGVVMIGNTPTCLVYRMNLFAGRGQWRYANNFVDYTYKGELMRGSKLVKFDDQLRIDRRANGDIQIHMNSRTSDAEFRATFVASPKH